MIKEIREDMENSIDDIFFEDPPTPKEFKKILTKLETEIEKVNKIPLEKRTFIKW